MKSRFFVSIAAVGLSVSALAGCGVRGAVKMPNPLITGAVAPNDAKQQRFWYEAMNGLPYQSASTHAQLVKLDDKQVCFDVKLRWLTEVGAETEDESFVDVNKLVPKLEVQEPEVYLTKSHIEEARDISRSSLMGKVTETQTEQQQICGSGGGNCYTVNIQKKVPKDKPFSVMDSGGRVCFEHEGKINKKTAAMILTFALPDHQDKASHRFAWKFENE